MEVVVAIFRRTSESRQVHSLSGARPFGRAPFFYRSAPPRRICPGLTLWPDAQPDIARLAHAGQAQDDAGDEVENREFTRSLSTNC